MITATTRSGVARLCCAGCPQSLQQHNKIRESSVSASAARCLNRTMGLYKKGLCWGGHHWQKAKPSEAAPEETVFLPPPRASWQNAANGRATWHNFDQVRDNGRPGVRQRNGSSELSACNKKCSTLNQRFTHTTSTTTTTSSTTNTSTTGGSSPPTKMTQISSRAELVSAPQLPCGGGQQAAGSPSRR